MEILIFLVLTQLLKRDEGSLIKLACFSEMAEQCSKEGLPPYTSNCCMVFAAVKTISMIFFNVRLLCIHNFAH